jgi:hypothetical protein
MFPSLLILQSKKMRPRGAVIDFSSVPRKFLCERRHRLPNIRLAVLAGHEEAQAGEFLGRCGIQDGLHVDTALK